MSSADLLVAQGTVVKQEKNNLYLVRVDAGVLALCVMTGKLHRNRIWLTVGDRVEVGLSMFDLTKGRITRRL